MTSSEAVFTSASPVVPVRAVHLDLKGCPPTFDRLLALLKIFAAARYNAVLVEWEDMFPWTVDERFRCETAYTPEQVKIFADQAQQQGLEIIPLVQCLGHMENVLLWPGYAHLREVPDRPDVLNVLAPGARELIERMIDDVLALTPQVRRLHLGGDEAWTFGSHPDTKAFIANHSASTLYLKHIGPLLDKLLARDIRPLLWHDMMVDWPSNALRQLAPRADLVVWGYRGHPDRAAGHYRTHNIERLHAHGLRLWGAGAYKGADGFSADLPDPQQRLDNARAWVEIAQRFSMAGLIATAWSRYNTHMPQNEPIDAASDMLFAVGGIFHDGIAPDSAAISAQLESLHELHTFQKCRDAMFNLRTHRNKAWQLVRDLHEFYATATFDPRRRGGARAGSLVKLEEELKSLDLVRHETHRVFAGLMPPIWIDRYLHERIEPLRSQLHDLQNLASAMGRG